MKITGIIFALLSTMLISAPAQGENGGEIKVGYTFIDEVGNRSVNQATFNDYEGLGLSFERFKYTLNNGFRLRADLNNITLNNRNMTLGLGKPGLFGIEVHNDQFRKMYDFEGGAYTRRHKTGGSIWFYPHRYLKVFGGGAFIGRSGTTIDLLNSDAYAAITDVDYTQQSFNAGVKGNYLGGMLQFEYRGTEFEDKISSVRDQTRNQVRFDGMMPAPYFQRLIITGGYKHFESKFSKSKFGISANTVWGGARIKILPTLNASYNFLFDRTSSDSDFVATDNISHGVYLNYENPHKTGVTIGYQYGINDDYEDEVQAGSYYFSGFCRAINNFEFRAEYGIKNENVKDGVRLLGDEEQTRHKISAKYTNSKLGSLGIKYESKNRTNDQIGSEVDFRRFATNFSITLQGKYPNFSGGYSYSDGQYANRDMSFEFRDHLIYGNIESKECKHITMGVGGQYYRSKRDLNLESFMLHFQAAWEFMKGHRIEAIYKIHNFDDFLYTDRYFTANIVEMNLIKELSF
jgi:hypothetical protein